ncbi:Helicase with zinc finger domain 2 [Mycena venus]|uniref:Vacuolar fusion protein MON1 n=1 Tax=Mycena venus TaxID=2733690 RepID=A0A8H6YPT7_9AGAR|nr:Helicase with zinc finger domain 2 [Mycena venus]
MATDGKAKLNMQSEDQLKRVAQISMNIREVVRRSLPAPPEQFFTMMIPGKVLDLDVSAIPFTRYEQPPDHLCSEQRFAQGFNSRGELDTEAQLLPRSVQVAEAILCDDMPALAPIQLGPTGRSVARSYTSTLNKLCPVGITVGTDKAVKTDITAANDVQPEKEDDSAELKLYKQAMKWLTTTDPSRPGKIRLVWYKEKQLAHTKAVEQRIKAVNSALKRITTMFATHDTQRQEFDKWAEENLKTYLELEQAAYMDWVVVGEKMQVEHYFAIVDKESSMSRVEASKKAMRRATIMDVEAAAEYQKVQLEPRNWAWLAKQKADAAFQGETADTIEWKISRLEQINVLLQATKDTSAVELPKPNEDDDTDISGIEDLKKACKEAAATEKILQDKYDLETKEDEKANQKPALDAAIAATLKAKKKLEASLETDPVAAFAKANRDYAAAVDALKAARPKRADKKDKPKDKAGNAKKSIEELENDVKEKQKAKEDARDKMQKFFARQSKANINKLAGQAREAHDQMFKGTTSKVDRQITQNNIKIAELKDKLTKRQQPADMSVIQNEIAADAEIPPVPAEPSPTGKRNFWTSISLEVKDTSASEQADSSTTSYAAGGSASWGMLSIGGSVSHSDSTSDVAKQMANSSMKISFDCMRVDIHRPWLHPELFYDATLQTALDAYISPGPAILGALMDPRTYPDQEAAKGEQLDKYSMFPMYPTAFLLAANVTLEMEGDTSDISSHFAQSSTEVSASIGYGPFSVSGSYAHAESHAKSTCETTANGCKIKVVSPQIIGWISQMVPALPRRSVVSNQRENLHFFEFKDIHTLLNTIHVPSTLNSPASASWIPVCLPKSSGFVNAYISFPQKDDGLEAEQQTADELEHSVATMKPPRYAQHALDSGIGLNNMYQRRRGFRDDTELMESEGTLDIIANAEYSVAELGIPGLCHFLYKSRAQVQITCPTFEDPRMTMSMNAEDIHLYRRLTTLYQLIHDTIHAKSGQEASLKLQYIRSEKESVMGWIAQPFKLYVKLSSRLPKSAAVGAANAVARWVKKEESSLFAGRACILNVL